jgi:hypothetical protein
MQAAYHPGVPLSRVRPKFLLLLALLFAVATAFLLYFNRRLDDQEVQYALNYTLIEPGLYVGGRVDTPPPGVRAILSLSETQDDYPAPIRQWSPIPDAAPAPSLDWLRQQVAFIDAQRRAGNSVFVHCDAGVSRGPMVAAAYLMWRNRWPRDQALAFLRTTRPRASPNPAFMDLLHDWELTLAPPVSE